MLLPPRDILFVKSKFNAVVRLDPSTWSSKPEDVNEFIDIKGWKSLGNKLPYNKIRTGSFKLKDFEKKSKKEKPDLKNNSTNEEVDNKEEFSIGDSIELNLDNDQLKMFDE